MFVNCGKTVSRTYRRSAEITAVTVRKIPFGMNWMIGWNPVEKNPTVGIKLITNGRDTKLLTLANWPLKNVRLTHVIL